MKQLVCEMCKSTDLIKKDGVFVCQNCGIKYSVDDVKNMMTDIAKQTESAEQVKHPEEHIKPISNANSVPAKNYVSCPHCGANVKKETFEVWQYIVAICLFPIGLLALLAGRKPATCYKCNTVFKTELSTVARVIIWIMVIGTICRVIVKLIGE
jgi:DNA-directed RNA polymerase subunit RPC12/RpoP